MEAWQLAQEIRKHNKLYAEGRPEISDFEYDRLVDELKFLDFDNDALKEVGAPVTYGKTVRHLIPMGSLDKIKYEIDKKGNVVGDGLGPIAAWVTAMQNKFGNDSIVASLKIDGIAGQLIYENGHLIQASTRGDGETGQDITDNILHVNSIPNVIDRKEKIVIRGEFYIPKDIFNRLAVKTKETSMTNERNLCAGAINSKDPRDTASKGIHFLPYRVWVDGREPESMTIADLFLDSISGFHFGIKAKFAPVIHHPVVDARTTINEMQRMRSGANFRTDGVVFSINNLGERESMGWVDNNPKGSVAFKFQTEQAQTRLIDIKWEASNFGVLTPVAEFAPVVLCDTVVRAAQLFNVNFIRDNHISIGNDVVVEKSGDIIPHIIRGIRRNMSENINYPELCPVCGKATVFDGTIISCVNPICPAILTGAIVNWLNAIEVSEPGQAMIDTMVKAGLVKNIADIYKLEVDKVKALPRCSEKLAKRYVENLSQKKSIPLDRFLLGLPIRGIGPSVWQDIANEFHSLKVVRTTGVDRLKEIPGIGGTTAILIVTSLHNLTPIIEELLQHITVEDVSARDGVLVGKSFCFTGTLSQPRKFYEKTVIDNGGILKTVGKELMFLVAGGNAGSKIQKAEKLGTKIINEEQFMEMVK
jgi:DNA ligase (NAD+)|nr:MAG TPA: DNA ligase [Caudoviricetes sp.]